MALEVWPSTQLPCSPYRKCLTIFLITLLPQRRGFAQVRNLCPQIPCTYVFSPVLVLSGRETLLTFNKMSANKMALLGNNKELQLGPCKPWQATCKSTKIKERKLFYRGEKEVGRAITTRVLVVLGDRA